MCRMLIYNPTAAAMWLRPPPLALVKLGWGERDWADLAAGIVKGCAAPLPLLTLDTVVRFATATGLYLPAPEAMAADFWGLVRDEAVYSRLVLIRNGAGFAIHRLDAPLWQQFIAGLGQQAEDNYLYQPHPACLISGRYVEVFAPPDPDCLICACALGEGGWDADEELQVDAFRKLVLELIWQVAGQAEVTFVDMDAWYAE